MKKFDVKALAMSTGLISAILMLLLGILGNLNIYSGAVNAMKGWHMYFTLSPLGILGGMIEAAIIGYALGWLFGTIYNKLAK